MRVGGKKVGRGWKIAQVGKEHQSNPTQVVLLLTDKWRQTDGLFWAFIHGFGMALASRLG